MKILNFYPYYDNLLREKSKWTTIRLGDQRSKFSVGQIAMLTIGWVENEANAKLGQVEITSVDYKRIEDLTEEDIHGESPDCTKKDSIAFVISAVYKKVVTNKDYVTIIKWKY